MQYISTMVSTLSQTTPVGTVKKQKKRDYPQYRPEYGAGQSETAGTYRVPAKRRTVEI